MKIIGLDVGTKRIGVSRADTKVKIAVPVGVVEVDGQEFQKIARLARLQSTDLFVLGLPRNNSGSETAQSAYVKNFAKTLKTHIPTAKIKFQDESLTSVEAESRLKSKKSYRKKSQLYQKGEVDAEAATIILQDFLESQSSTPIHNPNNPPNLNDANIKTKENPKMKKKLKTPLIILIAAVLLIATASVLACVWYNVNLSAIATSDCQPGVQTVAPIPNCKTEKFTVATGEDLDTIAKNLSESGLIKNPLVFKIHAHLSNEAKHYQAGTYTITTGMSAPEISTKIARGETDSNVFSFTMTPGTNTLELKNLLLKAGYEEQDVTSAFEKSYHNPVLSSRPAGDTSLEGYLYPDTYEFYKDSTASDVIEAMLARMAEIVKANNLEQQFAAHNLTLHEGITLASIIEEESTSTEYANVAAVFYNRLAAGMALGSDVTAKYAADLVDPSREIYSDNALVLDLDSPYNTRKHGGLPPGPISNPSLTALEAVAAPAQNDYLFFLTGDDGMMYYSSTESGHNQNAAKYCQQLCNVSL